MLGHKTRYFKPLTAVSLEDLVPEDHFYRQVERLLEVLRRGHRAAYVSNVKVDWQEPEGEFASFSIRMTD